MLRFFGVVLAALAACGGKPDPVGDAGVDVRPMPDAGQVAVDAGRPPPPPFDAGPPPPRTVFGSMVVNGVTHELASGFVSPPARTQQLRLGTVDNVLPRLLMAMVVPADAGLGPFTCGQTNVLLSAQYTTDAGTAFFSLDQVCTIGFTQLANQVGEELQGTFSGTLRWEPRSVLDAGFGVMTITGGNFRVKRTF